MVLGVSSDVCFAVPLGAVLGGDALRVAGPSVVAQVDHSDQVTLCLLSLGGVQPLGRLLLSNAWGRCYLPVGLGVCVALLALRSCTLFTYAYS
jgi:hypothetical protein